MAVIFIWQLGIMAMYKAKERKSWQTLNMYWSLDLGLGQETSKIIH